MMRTFASDNARISFEGKLATTELYKLEGASYEETETLKRNTIAPRLDFVVLPLALDRVPAIQKAIRSKVGFNGNRGIIHVLIEANGELVPTERRSSWLPRLSSRLKAKDIKGWTRQFPIEVRNPQGELIIRHKVDFRIEHNDDSFELSECKGFETRDWRIMKKLIEALWLRSILITSTPWPSH